MIKNGWTTVALNKKQICFLDEISKKAKFSGGRKLSRASILRAILKVAKKLDIDVMGIKTEKELRDRVLISFNEEFERGKYGCFK
jgi:tRNA U34 2-thiouridine synthase MnmA/TrmU